MNTEEYSINNLAGTIGNRSRHAHIIAKRYVLIVLLFLLLVSLIRIFPVNQPSDRNISLSSTLPGNAVIKGLTIRGIDKRERQYRIESQLAYRQTIDTSEIRLNQILIKITQANGKNLLISALGGEYNSSSKILVLNGEVKLHPDNGYEVTSNNASVNLSADTYIATGNVRGTGSSGKINANKMKLVYSGEDNINFEFSGQVHTVVKCNRTELDTEHCN